jgi:hypothetical protein
MGKDTMDTDGKLVIDPAVRRPAKARLEAGVSVDAAPEAPAWAIARGGIGRREATKRHTP